MSRSRETSSNKVSQRVTSLSTDQPSRCAPSQGQWPRDLDVAPPLRESAAPSPRQTTELQNRTELQKQLELLNRVRVVL